MALDSLGVGKRVGLGFAVSVFVLLILVLTSYFQLGRVAAAPVLSVDMKELVASGQNLVLILGFLGGLVICAAGFFCTRGVGAVFGRPVGRLSDCTSSIDLAVNQMTASSQLLADGTTGQAGDLEETASAVEELSSLTRSNADNTKEADTIMTSAREAFAEADSSIQKLTTSMGDITAASEQTQKIVKTIDEIAFQTNLLALNAAVEAARAGEAGAGFAVVADEVRNLAMRAADAAKDTSVMIDATVNKVQGGTALVNETNELFYMASKASERVGALIAEIATASEEQASGIDQIGKTIHDMDQRTQGLAATSEESASASITLRGQVAGLDKIAGELLALTGQEAEGFSPQRQKTGAAAPVSKSNAMMPRPAAGKPPVKQLPPAPAKTKSEDVIPFDDDDFEDF